MPANSAMSRRNGLATDDLIPSRIGMQLIDELRQQRSVLTSANMDNASGRLVAILDWLCKKPETKKIIEDLCDSIEQENVFVQDRRPRINANTPDEIAFVGYALMTNCRQHQFYKMCQIYDIRGPHRSSNATVMTRAGIQEYVDPFLDYLEDKLQALGSELTAASIIDTRISAVIDIALAAGLPKTSERLNRIASEFSRPEEQTDWHNIGNSCRHALQECIDELKSKQAFALASELKNGDVKGIVNSLANSFADSRTTLPKLIGAVWDHAQTVTHRKATTKADASRLFVWTYLAISEILDCLDKTSVQTESSLENLIDDLEAHLPGGARN